MAVKGFAYARDAITDANLILTSAVQTFTVPDAEASYKIVSDLPICGEIFVGYGKELLYLIFPNCQVPFARFHELPPSTYMFPGFLAILAGCRISHGKLPCPIL